MVLEKHKHHHAGKSSRAIISASEVFDLLNLPQGITFLDAGCGDGYFSIEAALKLGLKSTIIAIDIHKESLEKLKQEVKKRKLSNIEIIEADITKKLPLKDKSIDVYFVSNVLHGFDEKEKKELVKEVKRLLKIDGKFIVIEFKKEPTPVGPPLEIRISEEELKKFLKNFGFQFEKSWEVSPYNYLSIFRFME
ncbi:MAG: Ubiquinone/menaquinone biosynthesis C-methylase UbiE/MenG [Thermodesulfobacterium sp.]|uniref:Ubiquinone/menaquinone biosynthesis C-methylase UbiE/MenG n=1 Tax=Candidatus Thermodesulfobacterium syntrophicum TaxID=3060442 RepID=A0AAE3P5X5_9BACT|nr:Ubiquinone/menaquinone biosynthesis C-methylase UbiE/MenG [Candidatus Thermodesulfobacterium syntrophicum]